MFPSSRARDRHTSLALVEQAEQPPASTAWQAPAPERILPFADGPRANHAVVAALVVAVIAVVAVLWP